MLYFAYGSNLDPAQMAARCPDHRTVGIARLVDFRLCFPRFSPRRLCASAGIEAAPGEEVWGALYAVSAADLVVLHESEGYDPQGPRERNRYLFAEIMAEAVEAGPTRAMTYFAVPDGTTALPSRAYVGHIIAGARHHRLPAAYLDRLLRVETASD